MRIEGGKFGVKSSKTLRKVNTKDKLNEMQNYLMSKCSQYEGKALVDGCIVKSNEQYEKVDKSNKRVLNKDKKRQYDYDSETEE